MRTSQIVFVVAILASCLAIEFDLAIDTECQEWIMSNQKDLIMINQVATHSHIASCGQFCMIAGSGFRADTTTCHNLCERSGGYAKFSSALSIEGGIAPPSEICKQMFAPEEEAPVAAVSLLEVGQVAAERKLGIRGDLTVNGVLSTSILTSPIGDVKVSGRLSVMNNIESSSARAASIKATSGVSIKQGIVSKKEQLIIKGKIDADSVTTGELKSSFLEIDGVRQWSLHSLEDFEEVGVDGWSHAEVTECGGRRILGGHCVEKTLPELTKTFSLPPHTQVRVTAKYMFIDSWDGESGYMAVDSNKVWVDTYNHAAGDAKHGINMCGNETPERRFGVPIDVTIPHTSDSLSLSFGATLDEHPCDESFGIDSVMVFVR